MTLPKYVRKKTAKGKTYYYFDAGKLADGRRDLIRLPDIKNGRFGDCLARAKATRTNRKNQQGALTLEGLIRAYEKSPEFRDLSESSRYSYSLYLAKASKLLFSRTRGSPRVRDMEKKDVLALREALADTPGAANQVIRSLGALFAWAVENDKAKINPTHGVKKFSAAPHEPWPDDLLEEALDDPQLRMPVALLYFTGQRIGDTIKMRWNDAQNGFMRVYVQKKKTNLQVAMLPELQDMLEGQERPAVTILTNANGQPWTSGGLRRKLQEWASERGHHVVPHGLRKNAVNSLLLAGCTPSEVGGITDHSLAMVEHYSKSINRPELGRNAIVKLDAYRKSRNKAGK